MAERRGLTLRTKAHNHPVFLSLTPVPGARPGGRNIAAILRLTDTARLCDLEEALAEAQRLQAVGELAGGIAHDFNNLLTAILGRPPMTLAAAPRRRTSEDLAQIAASAERGAALVRQFSPSAGSRPCNRACWR